MFVELDPHAEEPLFQQLYRGIIGGIATGELPDGTPLEPVRKTAAAFGINPATVKKAYDLLRHDGIIDSHNRAKSFVALPAVPRQSTVDSIRKDMDIVVQRARCQGMATADITSMLHELLEANQGVAK